MRVAIIAAPYVPVPPVKYGGTEQVIYYLIKGLKELGHEPILLGPADSKVDCTIIPIVEKAIFFPRTNAEIPEHTKILNKALRKTTQELKKLIGTVDVVHSHGFDLQKFQGIPSITSLHGIITLKDQQYYLKRQNLYYVSISKNQQIACPDLQYVGVVYNGEDPGEFPIVTEPEDYVCWLGRFDREKNPDMAIKLAIALGIKIKVGGKLDHLGDGYYKEEVEPLFDHPLVEFLGELDFDQKVELLSKAKVNLHPTGFREPFGLTVLEAAYCGTPTIAIQRGSMPELIEDGRTGILVEDFSEAYHRIAEAYLMDREYIANRARLLFNYKTMAKQYLYCYQKVIDLFSKKKKLESEVMEQLHGMRDELHTIWTEQEN
jgi:glycosyltransferase involved in cell wall biosynthesis